eukprot:CCRYP_002031-RA/>CCRYP_002031-RA protein AED:0.10 eAED:0.10 QI:70/-1/1/1/-1/1/1/1832/687
MWNMIHRATTVTIQSHRSLRQVTTRRCAALESPWRLQRKRRHGLPPSRQFTCVLSTQITPLLSSSTSSSFTVSYFHSSSISPSDAFHGLSLDEDGTPSKPSRPRNDDPTARSNADIPEAQVVKTEHDKQRTRELIAELVRAEILAYSSPSRNEDDDDGADACKEAAAAIGNPAKLGPYERQMQQLQRAMEHHSKYAEEKEDALRYAKSCRNVGELNYRMGHMEQCQDILLDGLQVLMENDAFSDGSGNENEARLVKAQIMHCLGAVMARCGEYDEAFRWYEESLKLKRDLLSKSPQSQSCAVNDYHYEMAKTLNGLAALEIMSGGEGVDWEKAMTLFRDAERNYLHRYQQFVPRNETSKRDVSGPSDDSYSVPDWDHIPQEMVQQMAPHLVQLVINVRSNMGELLRQRGRHREAVEMFQGALDLAQLDVARIAKARNEDTLSHDTDQMKAESLDDVDSVSIDLSPEERRNAVVELLIKVADTHVAYENYDEAAASYERALASHVAFRKLTGDESNEFTDKILDQLNTRLPAATSATVDIPLDIANATTVEAAIRNNLAHALVRIDQGKLALAQYEIALQIKRHIGGDSHIEVAHTLMEMGALLGGPMKDVVTSLNCFKEALYIYRCKLDDLIGANSNRSENSRLSFYDTDQEVDEINEHIHNASRNIALIEDALLRDKDGVGKSNRR